MTTKLRWIIGFVFLSVMIITLGCGGESAKKKENQSKETMIEAKSEDILNDYIRDVGTAEQKYKDKKMKITGKVIDAGQFKNSTNFYVAIESKNIGGKMYAVLLSYPVDRVQEINQIKMGDFIVAEGIFQGGGRRKTSAAGEVLTLIDRLDSCGWEEDGQAC